MSSFMPGGAVLNSVLPLAFPNRRSRILYVRLLRQLAGVLMLGLAFGSPVMACLIPGAEMTAAERECCEHMSQQCGSPAMPSSHTCCHRQQRESSVSPVPTYSPTRPSIVALVPQMAVVLIDSASISRQVPALEAPPPERSPDCSSVLRI
jgi:hypothetical protein